MARIALVSLDGMSPAQKQAYDAILGPASLVELTRLSGDHCRVATF